ncbi:uncharacterized protein [Dermacentor albipictus]|uniref:uncharacterized protein isoform X2 n=1 Tax=Dermacentor albipictus TaxID=60249 RepID=UPI0031FC1438
MDYLDSRQSGIHADPRHFTHDSPYGESSIHLLRDSQVHAAHARDSREYYTWFMGITSVLCCICCVGIIIFTATWLYENNNAATIDAGKTFSRIQPKVFATDTDMVVPALAPRMSHSSSSSATATTATETGGDPVTKTAKNAPKPASPRTKKPTSTMPATSVPSVTIETSTKHVTSTAAVAATGVAATGVAATGLLLCTVGNEISTYIQLPDEKLCRYVFYESVGEDGTTGIMGDLGPARKFVDLAKTHSSTKFGISFYPRSDSEFMNSFLDADFQKALDALWRNKITHFGALSIYGDLVELDVLRRVLQALKSIYGHLVPKATRIRSPMMALGVAPDNISALAHLPELMMTEYVPHLFVSIAHLSGVDTSSSECLILPPSVFIVPPGVHPYYPHTVNDSIQLLQQVARATTVPSLALAFTLRARLYEPENPDPRNVRIGNYSAFKPCKPNYLSQFRPPASICGTKPNAKALAYHIAAYDIDYDASWSSACVFLTLRGPYYRLKLLCKLEHLLLNGYTQKGCRSRAFNMSSDNCDA